MLKIGDVVKLKGRYRDGYMYGLIVAVNSASWPGESGWVSFDYTIMTETGMILHISEGCVEEVWSSIK